MLIGVIRCLAIRSRRCVCRVAHRFGIRRLEWRNNIIGVNIAITINGILHSSGLSNWSNIFTVMDRVKGWFYSLCGVVAVY